jgi:hypothetical protein
VRLGGRVQQSRATTHPYGLWVRLDVPRRSLQRFNREGRGKLPARAPSVGLARPARHDTSALRDPATRAKFNVDHRVRGHDERERRRWHPTVLRRAGGCCRRPCRPPRAAPSALMRSTLRVALIAFTRAALAT